MLGKKLWGTQRDKRTDRAPDRETQRMRKGERDKDGGTERHKHRNPGTEEYQGGTEMGEEKEEERE